MDDDIIWNVDYWSKRFEETSEEAAPILKKAMNNLRSLDKLDPIEQYRLISILQAYASYSSLLRDDIDRHKAKPPVPFWKKLFRK